MKILKLNKLGLGMGGTLENAIVVKDNKLMNQSGLRTKLRICKS